MTKKNFFSLSFEKRCQFVFEVRQKLYETNTKEERDATIPKWMIEMVEDFEERYRFRNFASLFLGSLLMLKSFEDNEEVVCILDEINDNQLHLTIMELDNLIGLSWTKRFEEENDDEGD